ncbi:MAG: DUF885 domain-containing protein [Vicinamibacteria bacterium]|nr:DUF885 domain-containing protein [Vicinamibacteria bacterium]
MKLPRLLLTLILAAASTATGSPVKEPLQAMNTHPQLVSLFKEWRDFQKPPVVGGVPDYTAAAMAKQQTALAQIWKPRLAAFDTSAWTLAERNDYRIVEAEMNGLDFDHRVLRPWANDPSFYVMAFDSESDVPAREGPVHLAATELWKYTPPLAAADAAALQARLAVIPRVLEQARVNLVGDIRDLWRLGIRNAASQKRLFEEFAKSARSAHPGLAEEAARAAAAFDAFGAWLSERLPAKKGKAGIGALNYDWYMKHVHLSPYSFADEVLLMERELSRARAYLALAEHENKNLPPLSPIESAEEFHRLFGQGVTDFMKFLESRDVMTIRPWMDRALREREGSFQPAAERDFFAQVEFRDPRVMRCHGTHWFDRARASHEPHSSLIRQTPSLYNLWDSRAEGLATAAEEILMGAGLFADRPRSRELIYVLVANRAARGLAGLKVLGGELSLDEARHFASANTPRGWLLEDGGTNWMEQQLYLQQPGYGTSYLTGKLQIEKLMGDLAHQQGSKFSLRRFFDDFHAAGMMPVALIASEMRAAAGR